MPLQKVQILKSLNLVRSSSNSNELLLIEATGISKRAKVGIPKLVPVSRDDSDGIFELDFVLSGAAATICKDVECEIKVVYKLDDLPADIVAVKVNSVQNADIIMIADY